MTRLTTKQRQDLETAKFFIPDDFQHVPITDNDVRRYFDWSDKGIGKEGIEREARQTNTGLAALYWGKQRRDLQVASYIEDWGTYLTPFDFVDEPEFLVTWLARVMHKPFLLTAWRAHNAPDQFDQTDTELLTGLTTTLHMEAAA